MLSNNLLTFYAECFHKGNRDAARRELNSQHNDIRAKDASGIAFYLGCMSMLIITVTFFSVFADTTPNFKG